MSIVNIPVISSPDYENFPIFEKHLGIPYIFTDREPLHFELFSLYDPALDTNTLRYSLHEDDKKQYLSFFTYTDENNVTHYDPHAMITYLLAYNEFLLERINSLMGRVETLEFRLNNIKDECVSQLEKNGQHHTYYVNVSDGSSGW